MNIILKIILLSSAVVTKTHANEEETNNNNLNLLRGGGGGEERALSDDCVSRSTYLGCFNDRNQNRAMSTEIEGRGYTARECESACAERGFLYFGRQWRGQVGVYILELLVGDMTLRTFHVLMSPLSFNVYSASAPTAITLTKNMGPPQTAIVAAPTSVPTKCASTNFKLPKQPMQPHRDVPIDSTVLPTWGVMKIGIGRGRCLMRCMESFIVRNSVRWSVRRRGIGILLGSGEVNASVVIMYVNVVG